MGKLLSRLDFSYLFVFLSETTLGLTFLLYILLARRLGPDQYGTFAAAAALGGILAFFLQFGLPKLHARDIAVDPVEGPKLSALFLLIQGINGVVLLLPIFPVLYFLGFRDQGLIIGYLVFFSEICRSAKHTLRAVFRGLGQFHAETLSVAIERSVVFLLAIAILFSFNTLIGVVLAIVIVRFLDVLGLIYYLSAKRKIWAPITIQGIRNAYKMAYPFALSGVLFVLYYQIDVLMLKGLSSTMEVGFYSASFRIIEIFSALPRVIFLVSFTRFAQCYKSQPEKLSYEIRKSVWLLVGCILPVLVGACFGQQFLVEMLYGVSFSPAIPILAILLPSLSVKMFGNLVEQLLQATGREKYLPPLLLTTVVVNVIANAILIPTEGAVGAAIATLLSEIVLATVGLGLMIWIGYKQVGLRLMLATVISLGITSIPYQILHGLNVGVGILAIVISTLALLMTISYRPLVQQQPH